jgi:myosin-5
MIWVPSDSEAWEPAEVVNIEAKTITVRLVKDSNAIKRIQGDINTFERVDLECLRDSYENLVDMPSLSEGTVLHHVRKRYAKNEIYTLVGDILVAVNPFKAMESTFYDNTMMEKMLVKVKKHAKGAGVNVPHVFTVAATALHKMRQDGEDQSVLISGESGAGKTEVGFA